MVGKPNPIHTGVKNMMSKLTRFNADQITIINDAVEMAEELVSNHYKMSASQWLSRRYDVKTLGDLKPDEIIDGPFAQIIRYEGQVKDSALGSSNYDYYKICLQDHTVCATLKETPDLELYPFMLYIMTHELIHIVRFSKFLQNFEASPEERLAEEVRVHEKTHLILQNLRIPGLEPVFCFYQKWGVPYEGLTCRP